MSKYMIDLHLTLRFLGDQLLPDVVTKYLGVNPTFSKKMGERITTKRGTQKINKTSCWEWRVSCEDIESPQKNKNFISHLDELVTQFSENFGKVFHLINSLEGSEFSWIDIYVASDDPYSDVCIPLSSQSMIILAKTELNVELTFGVAPPDCYACGFPSIDPQT